MLKLMNSFYQNKHTNKAGRFSISKLSQSHPEFFNKKKKKNGNNFVSKSMGGGFSAKIKAPAAAKSPTAAKSSTAAKSPAKKSQETKGGKKKGKTNDVKKEEKESEPIETPKLTEVTIRDLQVSVERRVFNLIHLIKNIYNINTKNLSFFIHHFLGLKKISKNRYISTS